ncbi:succinate CoA transferase [bacterium]|nr:succinate CoA transferase [bacterium]
MYNNRFPILTPDEAAAHVSNGQMVAFSGFTPAGAAKAVPRALAVKARALHAKGEPFRIKVLTGASTGRSLDETLAEAEAISWRAPYQSSSALRKQMNAGKTDFVDMHLSHLPQWLSFGFFGDIDVAVIEASEVTADGRVYLSTSVGASPTFLQLAKKIIIEVNGTLHPRLRDMADIAVLPPPPHRSPIPIFHPLDRIGVPFVHVDPKKIVGIVQTNEWDEVGEFSPPDEASQRIAGFAVEFLLSEMKAGRIPPEFLPLQSGVGNVANAVMAGLGDNDKIPPFYMYSEVFQDSLPALMKSGKMLGASTTSLTVMPSTLQEMYEDMDFYTSRIVLRPQEYSNNPGVVRRLGVISMNTALEVDIYGHANSTHVCGTTMMNGIGGSGDFTRNAYFSIFMCPSVAKGGAISAIVPFCSHVDHNEHSVQVVITDQGIADLRGRSPEERAQLLINNCAHPTYRDYLRSYLANSRKGHLRHQLGKAFELHENFVNFGHMLGKGGSTSA